jgi:hypothetical protein
MIALSEQDDRMSAVVSLAADPRRLRRVARVVLYRDDAVTELLRAAAFGSDQSDAAWRQIRDVCDRRRGTGLDALDLVVEMAQQDRERAGEARTWNWPAGRGGNDVPRTADRKRHG